jgi:hypothetical protein
MRPTRRLIAAATAALTLLLVPTGLSAGPADAASHKAKPAGSNALTPGRLANIAMSDANSFTRGLAERSAVEASRPQIGVGNIGDVLGSAVQRTRPGCHPSDLLVATTWRSLCWSEKDDTARYWYPQGITGSGDAVSRTPLYVPCPGCPARKALAVSWHNTPNTLAKVTFVDVSAGMADAPYDDALLVVPDNAGRAFRALPSHASGVTWYGRYLLLFSSGEKAVQVFDLTHIWAMNNPGATSIGCDSATGGCSAAGMRFAIPRVGYYRFADGFGCWGRIGLNPCFSSVSLDRATNPDTLVTTEFNNKSGGRIVRWPLNWRTGRLLPAVKGGHKIIPTAGWKSTLKRQQGAAFYGRNGVVAGMCPEGTPGVSYMPDTGRSLVGGVSKSCLFKATLSSTRSTATLRTRYWTTAPRGLQNVSYWPGSREVWTLNEFPGTAAQPGSRQIIALDCPNLVCG